MIETAGLQSTLIEKCVNFFCDRLGIDVPNLFIFVDETMEPSGQCYQNGPDDYMIVLKPQEIETRIVQTLAHELVHVKQYIRDNLAEHFNRNQPYGERWWEIEAYEKEKILMDDLIKAVEEGTF